MPLLRLLVANLAALACIAVAGLLAYDGKDGWGGFLFAALLFGSTTAISRDGAPAEAGPHVETPA